MTNREWLMNEMQNMSDEKIAEGVQIGIFELNLCKEDCTGRSCLDCRLNWLKQEHNELSEVERNILTYLPKRYKYIARDSDGELYVYKEKPEKTGKCWHSNDFDETDMEIFNHLFQFIKWEDKEPYNIGELLKTN